MAKPRPDLPNTKKSARAYVKWLQSFPFVTDVYIAGSRAKGTARNDSDWDFIAVVDRPNVRFSQPRDMKMLHADLAVVEAKNLHVFPKAVPFKDLL